MFLLCGICVMSKLWTVIEALEWTEQRLARHGEENPRLASQMLTSHATGLTRLELYTHHDQPLSMSERARLRESIQRRLAGEPLQYIIGTVGFWHLELVVRPPVLIPRPETETLVELVVQFARKAREAREAHEARGGREDTAGAAAFRVLDVGTGTGAIALSLLQALPQCTVVATDIDEAAVMLARENAQAQGLDFASRLHVLSDDLASSLVADISQQRKFDVVVSNPPYVPTAEYETLSAEILNFESRWALDGGADGLAIFRRLAEQAHVLLKSGGLLAVELHETTLKQAGAYARSLAYDGVEIHKDLAGRERFLMAVRS
jgi:release factor glutamine methyltransferase